MVMDALGVLVEFGAAGTPADRFDLGHLRGKTLGDRAEPTGFGKRDARVELKLNGCRALVERRQETARQDYRSNSGGDHARDHAGRQRQPVVECPEKANFGAALEMTEQPAVVLAPTRTSGQQAIRQNG